MTNIIKKKKNLYIIIYFIIFLGEKFKEFSADSISFIYYKYIS